MRPAFKELIAVRKCKKGVLPNLIIIGAGRCGTTSLHSYLGFHPQITMSWEKEVSFFSREQNWQKGVEWYKAHFSETADINGETTPGYTVYPWTTGVAERMFSVVPHAKLIYILRDPVDRIVSAYITKYSEGDENRKIEHALTLSDDNFYICASKYDLQLQQYLTYFSESNILVITLEDLRDNPRQTLRTIFGFLGVDDTFWSPKFLTVKNPSGIKRRKNRAGMILKHLSETSIVRNFSEDTRRSIGRVLYVPFSRKIKPPNIDEHLREQLRKYLKYDIARLREFTGRDFAAWCV